MTKGPNPTGPENRHVVNIPSQARGLKGPYVEPAWVMPEGHHSSRVAKSGPVGFGPIGPKPNRSREQARGDHP